MLFGKRKRIVKRILIVEDEPLTAFDNEQMLIGAGYEVAGTVDRVADALPLLESDEGVDLILSDVVLTGGVMDRYARQRPLGSCSAVPQDPGARRVEGRRAVVRAMRKSLVLARESTGVHERG